MNKRITLSGEEFKALQEATGLSNAALSRELRVSQTTVAKWRRGSEVPVGVVEQMATLKLNK